MTTETYRNDITGEELALPTCDEYGIPTAKMPPCPKCGEDELGMFIAGSAMCYACGASWYRPMDDVSITVEVVQGQPGEAPPGKVDGPVCGAEFWLEPGYRCVRQAGHDGPHRSEPR